MANQEAHRDEHSGRLYLGPAVEIEQDPTPDWRRPVG